ncbi:hypothetical protein CVIRNUC_010946 [Coccomyxa viridis]|uniref:Metallo-beta-lactamase domain-containing protein n=1 Tax=Coccomyxa viridis TaxID=1274662 RepID=A0AAV1IK87_9CHLO|nr:hypothetical protein CVIRNUC_010946 [Coccomyxa viridis]
MPRGPLVLAAVGVLLALTATQVTKRIKENSEPSRFDKAFEVLAPNVWRQGYQWANLGGLVGVDVYTFLIKADGKYILIDAGAPTSDAAEVLLKGLDDVMNGSKLQLIMLTHGHPDHSGALAALVKAYPGAQVVFHEEEAPYLLGHKSYKNLPADSLAYKAFVRVLVSENNFTEAVPASKALLLRGKSGDVADVKGPAGNNAQWLPRQGTLKWQHVPGHAPGQVALIHKPSQSMIPGDAVAHMAAKAGGTPEISLPPAGFTWNNTQARLDALKLASLPFSRAYPSHDLGTGISKAELDAFAASLQA